MSVLTPQSISGGRQQVYWGHTVTRVNVLLVEDEDEMRDTLSSQLALHEDFDIFPAEDGAHALEIVSQRHFDVILLDVGLPDMDGRDVCRLMRRKGVHAPIIMLTGMQSDADIILGLDSGANDYVLKPFRIGVLLARIRAHLRQHEASEDASFSVGPYTFKPSSRLLINRETGKEVSLSDKECSILKFLYRAGDSVVSCDTLYSEIWDHAAPLATHTLQTHIYRLRQKIETDPGNPQILISEGGGYRVVR
ncbi:MAG: response regulator transcription factor [Rhodospirillaceae bacterium]|jgi:DNA-binding response OmpR family regulator|nr:response regulator transcription factor [Rhodospirillaceae bacterium]MBT5458954.1 response regulator transcription factor [Rhodospirillaceae bacterium]